MVLCVHANVDERCVVCWRTSTGMHGLTAQTQAAHSHTSYSTGPRMNNSSFSATAYDEYSIMVVAGARESQARVDVLDLRTWRWREGIKQLQRPQIDSKGVSVVAYEGKVLALGGGELPTPEPQAGGDGQDEQQQQQDDDLGGQAVYSYDPAANTWSSDTIARLPFNISMASPVVARVSA
jgi:hypothetical protein